MLILRGFPSSPCHGSGSVLLGFSSGPQDKPLQLLQTGRKQEQTLIKGLSPTIWQENRSQTSSPLPGTLFRRSSCGTHGRSWPQRRLGIEYLPFPATSVGKGVCNKEKGKPTFATSFYLWFFLFITNQICFPKARFGSLSQNIIPTSLSEPIFIVRGK